jgi:hypothetical protein
MLSLLKAIRILGTVDHFREGHGWQCEIDPTLVGARSAQFSDNSMCRLKRDACKGLVRR